MKEQNKAQKAMSAAKSDIWESAYLVGGYRMKKDAKRTGARANRRHGKAAIREALKG